jgi:lysophospholipase L1-like esterase
MAEAKPSPRLRGSWRLNLLLLLFTLLLLLICSEIFLRIFYRSELVSIEDERTLLYAHDSTLGWFPRPSSHGEFVDSRRVAVSHNSNGFRDPEPGPRLNALPKVIVLGDSFVWGYDVEGEERFTEKLRPRHPQRAIYNFGVSGYGTDQEFLLWQREANKYKPRIVLLVFCCENDSKDNSWNVRNGGYFKPFFVKQGAELRLQGIPVPKGERAILSQHRLLSSSWLFRLGARIYCAWRLPPRLHHLDPTLEILAAMKEFSDQQRTWFGVGLTSHNEKIETRLKQLGVPWIDLSTTNRYPTAGGHWNPQGHQDVADKLDAFLPWD